MNDNNNNKNNAMKIRIVMIKITLSLSLIVMIQSTFIWLSTIIWFNTLLVWLSTVIWFNPPLVWLSTIIWFNPLLLWLSTVIWFNPLLAWLSTIIWFNLPFSKNVATKTARYFLDLIQTLSSRPKFHKIFNRNNINVTVAYRTLNQPSTHTAEKSFTHQLTTKVEQVTVLIKQTALYKKDAWAKIHYIKQILVQKIFKQKLLWHIKNKI